MKTSLNVLHKMVELDNLKELYIRETGSKPFNISHWDAGNNYLEAAANLLRIDVMGNPCKYEFSYTLPEQLKANVAVQLGVAHGRKIYITPNGTSANLLALVMASQFGKKRLIIIGPCYFQIPIVATSLGFDVLICDAWSTNEGLDASKLPTLYSEKDVIWITNPIYCFNSHYNKDDLELISSMLSSGILVIADECNGINGKELASKLSKYNNFIGTYAPHKAICINGLKFGALILGDIDESKMDYLYDFWVGPLARSVVSDLNHFISPNYKEVSQLLDREVLHAEAFFENFIGGMKITCHKGTGHFRVISINGLSNKYENSLDLFRNILYSENLHLIPMSFNSAPSALDFSFRVNILANQSTIVDALPRLITRINRFTENMH